jgi:hypothetical protein
VRLHRAQTGGELTINFLLLVLHIEARGLQERAAQLCLLRGPVVRGEKCITDVCGGLFGMNAYDRRDADCQHRHNEECQKRLHRRDLVEPHEMRTHLANCAP